MLIEPMPDFGHELISDCKAKIPEMVEVDSMLLTFSDGIPPHHDKRFISAGPETVHESFSSIFLLSFGASCKHMLTHCSATSERTHAQGAGCIGQAVACGGLQAR